ncbi:MAG: hypothetical protein GEV08_11165 [Acidimicrobiia bacterium]|nr:hypothetical protein [Acidimicrobiia bacterium]
MRGPAPIWPLAPRRILVWGTATALVLCGLSYLLYARSRGYYVPELDVGTEGSVAAWLSSTALAGCAVALLWISRRDRPGLRRAWRGLAVMFACLSLDESASVHEKAIDPLQSSLGTSGPLLYAWVVPGAVVVLVVGAWSIPFLRALERPTALAFVLAGAAYVGGALGFEVLGGALAPAPGEVDLLYAAVATVEELLEMLGITFFLAALAHHAGKLGAPGVPGRHVRLQSSPTPHAPSATP